MTEKFKSSIKKYLENNQDFIWAFDLDDTVAQTQRRVIKYVNQLPETVQILKDNNMFPLKYDDINDFYLYQKIFGEEITKKIFSFDELYSNDLELNDGLLDFINFIKKHFGADKIRIVTASFEGVEDNKDIYIANKLGIPKHQVIHSHDKHKYVNKTIYFDDGFHNFLSVLDCDETLKICIETPWNLSERENTDKIHYSIKNFHEILPIFEELIEYFPKKAKKSKKQKKSKTPRH